MKTKNLLFYFIVFVADIRAQECNCLESFNWMVSTFEKNDAGFQYIVDKKGTADYQKHTALYLEKSKAAFTLKNCQAVMFEWLLYFRSGHIGVNIKPENNNENIPVDKEIRLKYSREKKIDLSEKTLLKLLSKKQTKHPIEGVWQNGNYTIGIISNEKSTTTFIGFILKADSVYWMPGQIKAEFRLNNDRVNFSVNYFMRDHSKQITEAKFINNAQTILQLNGDFWTRSYPQEQLSKTELVKMLFYNSELPFIEKLSEQTVYLRIPSFLISSKKNIDSVLTKNDSLISSTQNLIIDIRNGTGGSDDSYKNIIPYLYTQPIRHVGMQLLATELNAMCYENYALQTSDTQNVNYCNRIATKMRANIGQFITLSDQNYSIDSLEHVLPLPKKIAILCNKYNGSTDEQFLIDAKQSLKVKVFGQPTGGMLDISNGNIVDFPNGKFQLFYCTSKSYRIPKYCIDGVGVQPDYFIDDTIDEYNWIDHTKNILEK